MEASGRLQGGDDIWAGPQRLNKSLTESAWESDIPNRGKSKIKWEMKFHDKHKEVNIEYVGWLQDGSLGQAKKFTYW